MRTHYRDVIGMKGMKARHATCQAKKKNSLSPFFDVDHGGERTTRSLAGLARQSIIQARGCHGDGVSLSLFRSASLPLSLNKCSHQSLSGQSGQSGALERRWLKMRTGAWNAGGAADCFYFWCYYRLGGEHSARVEWLSGVLQQRYKNWNYSLRFVVTVEIKFR